MRLWQIKSQKILIFSYLLLNLIFSLNHKSLAQENNLKSIEDLRKFNAHNENILVIINKKLEISNDLVVNKNIILEFKEKGSFKINENINLRINGLIKAKKKIFYFEDKNNGYKNLHLDNENFDVRWFGKPEEFISQKYSSYHRKTMFFDNYVIKKSLNFRFSNIKAHFNNTTIEKTFHFSDHPYNENEKYLENIKITGNINIQERLGGLKGKNIFIEKANLVSSENQMPGGVHIYDSIENLHINYLYIEDSIRNYAFGIDSSTIEKRPKNIFINEIEIKNSFVHGVLINGDNIEIKKIKIDSFGDIRKSNYIDQLSKGFNIPLKFDYLDLFEHSPKGLVIAYGSNINIDKIVIKTENYSIINFLDYIKIKNFFIWPSIYFVDLTNEANIKKISLEIPKSLKIFNSILNFSNNLLFKILNMGDGRFYKVNEGYINLRPFKISN